MVDELNRNPTNMPLSVEHIRNCHERFLTLMMGKQSGETASARLRAFTRIAACDDVGTLSQIRHDMRHQVTRGDPSAMLRIDEYKETARDELIAAQVMTETSRSQDRVLALAHRNAVTRLQGAAGSTATTGPANHGQREKEAVGGGLAAAAVSYAHIASGRWPSFANCVGDWWKPAFEYIES